MAEMFLGNIKGADGKDGYTPVKGVDYFDGADGYTPVKGVDYFDGADGKDGENGKDYVLTDADKQEIAEMVIDNLSTEAWTFTLENGSTVTKTVVLK